MTLPPIKYDGIRYFFGDQEPHEPTVYSGPVEIYVAPANCVSGAWNCPCPEDCDEAGECLRAMRVVP